MYLPDLHQLTMFDASLREVPIDVDAVSAVALAIHQALLELYEAETLQNEHVVISLLGYLGNACRIVNRLDESIQYLERAVSVSQASGDRKSALVNTIRLAEARKYHGEHATAEILLRSALNQTDENGYSAYKDFVLQHLAKCRLEQGAIDEAVQLLQEALVRRVAKGDSELIESTKLALQQAQKVIGSPRNTVHLDPHNPIWQTVFERSKTLLFEAIGSYVVDVQHIGSTSIVGLEAKPIIDIAVAVDSFDHLNEIEVGLHGLGYFRLQAKVDGKVVFAKDTDVGRTHYIYLELHDGSYWNEQIAFRDYLRTHPEAETAYVQIKRQLAEKYPNDVKSYTDGKRPFVDEVLRRANGA